MVAEGMRKLLMNSMLLDLTILKIITKPLELSIQNG
ncbi:Uncharacterised protein [Mycobacterium tuberculosis]|nr:Uncharacterised protein [Mycobacterium tuberculosis]